MMMNNKRYVIFAGENYYPQGGSKDINCFCDSLDEAKNIAIGLIQKEEYEWVEVYDLIKQESCFGLGKWDGKNWIAKGDGEWVKIDE
jgi:hypothetical protein